MVRWYSGLYHPGYGTVHAGEGNTMAPERDGYVLNSLDDSDRRPASLGTQQTVVEGGSAFN